MAATRTFETKGFGTATIVPAQYVNGGLAIQLTCPMGGAPDMQEPLARLSMWLDATPYLPKNCFFVKTYSENELIIHEAAASGWFKQRDDLHTALDPVWELLDEKGEGFTLED